MTQGSTSGARRAAAGDKVARPPRPALVELAAAILVVGGVLSILSSIEVVLTLGQQGQPVDALSLLSLAIGLGFVVLGVLARYGRAWLVAVNVVAVAAFLELISATIIGLLFGALDVFVVLALFWERPWFQWRPPSPNGP
ncbi:MAG TPA: hypothetical protein VJ506_11970 [Candidatus Limnocylindrales bacterium]|nr:hypothetical protein [Candidatus Limnocylindrales bacterium]